jgi:hypothetical protein
MGLSNLLFSIALLAQGFLYLLKINRKFGFDQTIVSTQKRGKLMRDYDEGLQRYLVIPPTQFSVLVH